MFLISIFCVLGVFIGLSPESTQALSQEECSKIRMGKPFIASSKSSDDEVTITVGPGELARLPCSIGQPGVYPTSWLKVGEDGMNQALSVNDAPLKPTGRITVEVSEDHKTKFSCGNSSVAVPLKTYSLNIAQAKKSDEGLYECRVQMSVKMKEFYRIRLIVQQE